MERGKINICHIVSGDLWAGAEAQTYALLKGLFKRQSLQLNAVIYNEGLLSKKLEEAGIHVDVIDEKKNSPARVMWSIRRILREKKVHIVHTHGYKETFLGGLAARLCQVKGIVRTHHGKGVVDSGRYHRIVEKINSTLLSDKLISVSEDLKRCLIEHRFHSNNITVIHNGILCEDVKASLSADILKKELQIPERAFVVGTLGRIVPVKGHRYLLEGARKVLGKFDHVVFVVAGDGPLLPEMNNMVKQFGIEDKVRFTGFRGDPFDVMNMFDIFVMTSLHEGIPTVLLEAMWLGKPVIATKVGGIPEIISHRWNGLLIAEENSNEVASACIELIEDECLRDNLSRNARKDFKGLHDIERVAGDVERLYRGLL